jgi:2-polyprenyl-3-methyl-5-hydroxy-6-metoxy-1,4-benzoquinol methylase
MGGFLKNRQPELVEWMDRPDCDLETLNNTYHQFSTINSLLSGWYRIYKTRIRPLCTDKSKTYTLLDIGFGGGDIPLKLAKWATADNINLDILAIELDDRALKFVEKLDAPTNIKFKKLHSSELIEQGKTFDFVISNHVLHHLKDEEVQNLLEEVDQLAKCRILFSDIERNAVGYALFKVITPLLFQNSFITKDGLISIQRSFTFEELEGIIPKKWKLDQMPLFRLVLTLDKS